MASFLTSVMVFTATRNWCSNPESALHVAGRAGQATFDAVGSHLRKTVGENSDEDGDDQKMTDDQKGHQKEFAQRLRSMSAMSEWLSNDGESYIVVVPSFPCLEHKISVMVQRICTGIHIQQV